MGRFQILGGRGQGAFVFSCFRFQRLDRIVAVGFVLGLDPFGIGIAARILTDESEPALRWALEIGFEEVRCDSHG